MYGEVCGDGLLQVDQQRGMPDKKNKRGGARARARDGGRTTAQRKHNTHDSTHLPTCLFIFVSVFASRRVSQVGNEKLFATMMPPPLRRNRILEVQMPTVSPNEPCKQGSHVPPNVLAPGPYRLWLPIGMFTGVLDEARFRSI